MYKNDLFKTQISNFRQINDKTFLLSFKKHAQFVPGQVVAITLNTDISARLYSIASGVNQNEIDILFDVRPFGKLTPMLSNLRRGNTIFVSEPFGKFIDTAHQKSTWIATGTGVAPFISKVKSGLVHNKTFIHGARFLNDFYFQNLFEEKLPLGNYIRCITGQQLPENTVFFQGRLTEYLKNLSFNPMPDQKFYLCGSAEMVVTVRDILIAKNVPFENIVSETYY